MRFAKPLDTDCLHGIFRNFKQVLIVEDGILAGGFGSAVIEFMCDNNYQANVKRLGVPDTFVEHGTQAELYKECGFDPESIYQAVKKMVSRRILSKVV